MGKNGMGRGGGWSSRGWLGEEMDWFWSNACALAVKASVDGGVVSSIHVLAVKASVDGV